MTEGAPAASATDPAASRTSETSEASETSAASAAGGVGETGEGEPDAPPAERDEAKATLRADAEAIEQLDEGGSAVVPVPGTLRQERRPSFWKRIGLRAASRAAGSERLLERLDAIESRVASAEQHLSGRIQHLDDRFTEVWEVEEQLSQMNDLRASLDEIASRQLRLTEQLRGISRRMTFVTLLVLAAAAAVVASLLGV